MGADDCGLNFRDVYSRQNHQRSSQPSADNNTVQYGRRSFPAPWRNSPCTTAAWSARVAAREVPAVCRGFGNWPRRSKIWGVFSEVFSFALPQATTNHTGEGRERGLARWQWYRHEKTPLEYLDIGQASVGQRTAVASSPQRNERGKKDSSQVLPFSLNYSRLGWGEPLSFPFPVRFYPLYFILDTGHTCCHSSGKFSG